MGNKSKVVDRFGLNTNLSCTLEAPSRWMLAAKIEGSAGS